MSEKGMWRYIANQVARESSNAEESVIRMERVTEKLKRGVPDVRWVTPERVQGMLELKWLGRAEPGWRVPITRDQLIWLRRDRSWGGRSAVLLHLDRGWLLYYSRAAVSWIEVMEAPEPLPDVWWPMWPGLAKLTKALVDQP